MSENVSRLTNVQFVLFIISIVTVISVYYFSIADAGRMEGSIAQYASATSAFAFITVACIISIALIEIMKVKVRQDILNQTNASDSTKIISSTSTK